MAMNLKAEHDWPVSLKTLCFAASGVCTNGKMRLLLLPTCFPPGDLGEAGRLKFQDEIVQLDEGTAHAFRIIKFLLPFNNGTRRYCRVLHAKS